MKKLNISKEFLYKEYITNKKSAMQIAELFGCSESTILSHIKINEIKIRSNKEAQILRNHKGDRNGNFKDGRTLKKYCCTTCGKEVTIASGFYGKKKCQMCGGFKGHHHTQQAKNKIKLSSLNRRHSEETKLKIGRKNKGKILTEKAKQKISLTKMGVKLTKEHKKSISRSLIGHKCSKETRRKISRIHKGKKMSAITRKKISLANKGKTAGRKHINFGKPPKHGKGSYYKNHYMRSSWEIAYAKYLDNNNIKWQYEPKPFEITYNYKGIEKEGTYTPDFYLPETKEYIEIKGWWRDQSKLKFNAFKIQYPTTKLTLLMKQELNLLGVL